MLLMYLVLLELPFNLFSFFFLHFTPLVLLHIYIYIQSIKPNTSSKPPMHFSLFIQLIPPFSTPSHINQIKYLDKLEEPSKLY